MPSPSEDIARALGSIDERLKILIETRLDHEVRLKTLETMAANAQGGWKIIILLASLSGAVGAFTHAILTHFKP